MSYVSPHTWADGDLLLASQLNDLANDVIFLAGLASGINIPFQSIISGAGSGIDAVWMIRHRHRYLLYYITQNASTSDQMKIRYDGTEVYSDTGDRTAPYLWSGHIDLNSTPGGLVVGDWYQIDLDISQKTGSGVTQCVYLLESPSTSL